jgi:uncharacterized protein YebE (UPF0316 family)
MEMIYSWVLLPLLIFFARVADVSLGTIRIIFISKGFKFLSFITGFVEVLIWLAAINQLWANLSNVWLSLAYAAGFATGNYVGIVLEEKISLGYVMVRIIIRKNSEKLIQELKKNNYPLTILDGKSSIEKGNVKMIFSVIPRKELQKIFSTIRKINPKAFYTVEDVKSTRKNEYLITNKRNGSVKF